MARSQGFAIIANSGDRLRFVRDICADLAALAAAVPAPVDMEAGGTAAGERHEDCLRARWDVEGVGPLLGELVAARDALLAAERRLRVLLAYGREFVGPRPYRLEDLARAAGMSISGVRTAYGDDEIAEVARATGARRRAGG